MAVEKLSMGKIEEQKERKYLNITSDRKKVSIPIDEIRYVESNARKLTLYMMDDVVSCYAKISDIEDILKENGFIRIHQSFIVRKNEIKKVTRETLQFKDREFPISRRYYSDVRKITLNEM